MISNKIFTVLFIGFFLAFSNLTAQDNLIDITEYPGQMTTQYDDAPTGEGVEKLFDNNTTSKHLTFHNRAWVQFKATRNYIVTKYTLTSANDYPERDPKSWVFKGSSDGKVWKTLDTQSSQDFSNRYEKKEYAIENTLEYRFYRLDMINNSGDILQLAELELLGVQGSGGEYPMADFTTDIVFVSAGDTVTFSNLSTGAESYFWDLPGTETDTTSAENPKVVYTTSGIYDVTLTAINETGSDIMTKSNYISVIVPGGDWQNFVAPTIHFEWKDSTSTGAQIYKRLIPDPEQFIRDKCVEVCKLIYFDSYSVPELTDVYYTLEYYDGISAKGGTFPNISIQFSTKYIESYYNSHGHNDQALLDEITGVLVHELTHGYQLEPKGAGGYQSGTEFFGFIEGMADYVRYKAGCDNINRRRTGGHWTDGYTTTGFFMDWLSNEKDSSFLLKLNASTITINPWSFDKATNSIIDVGVLDLWNEYQAYLGNPVDVEEADGVPTSYMLYNNYPNPFNPSTVISFALKAEADVSLKVYNSLGEEVNTLLSENVQAGTHNVRFNASNLASGIYFYQLNAHGSDNTSFVDVKKMMYLK